MRAYGQDLINTSAGGSSGESNSNEQQSVYVFGTDENFIELVRNSIFQGNQLIPLSSEAVKLKSYAMTDESFGCPRTFFLLEIFVEAFPRA